VVLVGNASGVRVAASRPRFETFETVDLADLDLTSANFKRALPRAPAAGGACSAP